MKKFVGLRPKTYNYLTHEGRIDKKTKRTKRCVIKRKPKLKDYKNCLEATQLENEINHLEKMKLTKIVLTNKLILKIQQRFKSERDNVFTGEFNKVALSSNDDKRVQLIDSI